MKARFNYRLGVNGWLLVVTLVAVVAAASLTLGACGSGGDDQALFEKLTAVWIDRDVAGAEELYAADANVYWNWPSEGWAPAEVATGIEEIGSSVASYPVDPTMYGDTVYVLDIPADKDVEQISGDYQGARFISAPVRVGTELYMVVLEVRDGKIVNQYVEGMHR